MVVGSRTSLMVVCSRASLMVVCSRGSRGLILVLAALCMTSSAQGVERVTVVASFSVISDMLATVAGGHVEIRTIVGAGSDCELYQPTPADVATIASAEAVFFNGLNDDFEPWLEPLLRQAAFKGAKVVVTRGVRTLTAEEEHPISGRQLPTSIDQHAWLDPRNGATYVRNIAAALVRLDPANAVDYRARATNYANQILALDTWARQEMAEVPATRRRVLASHDSLQYIAAAYGITLLAVNGWTNASEPSAAELEKLARQIRAEHVRAVFLDSITDPRAIRRIASESGATVGGTLYGDSLSPAGGEADSYLRMLRHDVATLKAGMLAN
jgi:zinc/manganese transport system substrate-binding protein